jgi:hypothetical protein
LLSGKTGLLLMLQHVLGEELLYLVVRETTLLKGPNLMVDWSEGIILLGSA